MIRKKEERRELVIDLTGPEGNVFVLMAYARKLSRDIRELYESEMQSNREFNLVYSSIGLEDGKLPESLADQIIGEMMQDDYEHAVMVFDKYFGSFVILER